MAPAPAMGADPFGAPAPAAAPAPAPAMGADPFGAVFILHDPNSWGAELQVALDVILGDSPLGSGRAQSVPVYASNADLTFAGAHAVPRLAAGAFVRCLRMLFRDITGQELVVQQVGKPSLETSSYARSALAAWRADAAAGGAFDRLVHIGDNPAADMRMVLAAGDPWRGALVRSGIFRGPANDAEHPGHLVTDTVGDVIDALLAGELD